MIKFPEAEFVDAIDAESINNIHRASAIVYPWANILGDLTIGHYVVIGALPRPPAGSATTEKMDRPLMTTIHNNVNIGNSSTIYAGATIRDGAYIADMVTVREQSLVGESTVVGRGSIVEPNVVVGRNVRIEDGVQLQPGTIVEDEAFIAPGVQTTNDNYLGRESDKDKWFEPVIIKYGAMIGANATLLPGVTVGENAVVGSGSIVTKDVPDGEIWVGNPARYMRDVDESMKVDNLWEVYRLIREEYDNGA